MKSLRLLKSSGIYRDHSIQFNFLSYTPDDHTKTVSPFLENVVIGKKCELDVSEVDELLRLFKYLFKEKDTRFRVALERLTGGMEKRRVEDRLIDYMIGLETLYLPDGTAELSFRLSLRISFLLFQDQEERKKIFKFLRDMYDIRSKIVHGKEYKLIPDDVLRMEELLRQSLKLWIKDKSNFLAKTPNKNDGKLNTVFFD